MEKNSTLFYTTIAIPSERKDRTDDSLPESSAPGEAVIQNILNFSKALKVAKVNTQSRVADVESVEMILN